MFNAVPKATMANEAKINPITYEHRPNHYIDKEHIAICTPLIITLANVDMGSSPQEDANTPVISVTSQSAIATNQ